LFRASLQFEPRGVRVWVKIEKIEVFKTTLNRGEKDDLYHKQDNLQWSPEAARIRDSSRERDIFAYLIRPAIHPCEFW
jgi:hypothetical protein